MFYIIRYAQYYQKHSRYELTVFAQALFEPSFVHVITAYKPPKSQELLSAMLMAPIYLLSHAVIDHACFDRIKEPQGFIA